MLLEIVQGIAGLLAAQEQFDVVFGLLVGFSPCVAKLRNPTSENLRCEPGRRTGDTAFGHDERRSKEGSTTNRQSLVKREHVARTFFSVLSVSRTFNFRI